MKLGDAVSLRAMASTKPWRVIVVIGMRAIFKDAVVESSTGDNDDITEVNRMHVGDKVGGVSICECTC